MTGELQKYFPMIRSREAVISEILSKEKLKRVFDRWPLQAREEFLDFCSGCRGVKMLYDFASKEVLNPEYTPERLDEFLSLLLQQKVRILEVLPNDGTRLADESSLLVMDIVVQLEDGSIVNLEVQKMGYMFPGERSACYSADLLLRQYKRSRSRRKKKFSYKNIKDVYTIVLFEHSPGSFDEFPESFQHHFEQRSDTGLELNLLQKYIFIPLDIFRKLKQNKDGSVKIGSRLDAWLAFLCMDEPEAIISIIEKYPDFREMYEQIYTLCQNIEEVMQMFSRELQEMDRNTVKLMIDEMQKDLDEKKKDLKEVQKELDEKKRDLEDTKKDLDEKSRDLEDAKKDLKEKNRDLEDTKKDLKEKNRDLEDARKGLKEKSRDLEDTKKDLKEKNRDLEDAKKDLKEAQVNLRQKDTELSEKDALIRTLQLELEKMRK